MTTHDEHSYESLKFKMARGAVWMIGMRWSIRAIGLLNTILLARLLTPQDFGIIAMATVVIGLLDSITDFRTDIALLRDQAGGHSRYDSAWTLQVLSGLLKAGILIGIAPLLAAYYGDLRVETVIYIFAAGATIAGFENIGQVEFRRELRFGTEFRYWVYRRIITFLVSLAIVLWLRSYLALAIATPINGIVTVVLSYVMSPYRPRFAVRFIAELWGVSKWLTLLGFMRFFGNRGEAFVLGGLGTPPGVIGEYEISAGLSTVITQEFVGPTGRVLMPSYAKFSEEQKQLRRAFTVSFGILTSLSLATGVGVSVLSETLVTTLLGNQWQNAATLLQWLALHGGFLSVVDNLQPYFFVTRRERLMSLCYAIYVVILVPAVVFSALTSDVEVVAATRAAVTFVFLLSMIFMLGKEFGFNHIVEVLWRPILATIAMALTLLLIRTPNGHILSLVIDVIFGFLMFSSTLFLLWTLAGRPNGAEAAMITFASHWISTVRGRS